MEKRKIKKQLSFFGSLPFSPNSSVMAGILNKLDGYGLFPTMVQVFDSNSIPSNEQKIALISNDGLQIVLDRDRIDFVSLKDRHIDLESLSTFAGEILGKLKDSIHGFARVAVVEELMVEGLVIMQFEALQRKYLPVHQGILNEWKVQWSESEVIDGASCHCWYEFGRIQGLWNEINMPLRQFDAFRLVVDISTDKNQAISIYSINDALVKVNKLIEKCNAGIEEALKI